MVEAFDHARPLWWYLPWVPAVLFPFVAWPRAWAAVAALRRRWRPACASASLWMLPVFLVFCLISGKQTYYLLPELPAAMLLMAGARCRGCANARARAGSAGGPWPLGVGAFALAVALFALPLLVAQGRIGDHWLRDLSVHSAPFGVVYVLLGA